MSIKDGWPFHPCEVRLTCSGELLGAQTGNAQGIHTGASLRDVIAIAAMQGILAREYTKPTEAAQDAYDYADAMLRAREVQS